MEDSKTPNPENGVQLNAFLAEFQIESDRGAALLGAAMLDTKLREILTDFLIEEPKIVNSLFDDISGPLKTFSAKTKLAYCLGLITRDERDNIDVIRAVRNEFAHKIHGLSFNDEKIAKLCRKLRYDRSAVGLINLPSPRHSFTLSTAVLLSNLTMREVNHCPVKKATADWIQLKSGKW